MKVLSSNGKHEWSSSWRRLTICRKGLLLSFTRLQKRGVSWREEAVCLLEAVTTTDSPLTRLNSLVIEQVPHGNCLSQRKKNHCHQLVLRSPLNSILIFTLNKFTCQEQEILVCVSFSFQVVFNTRLSVVNYPQDWCLTVEYMLQLREVAVVLDIRLGRQSGNGNASEHQLWPLGRMSLCPSMCPRPPLGSLMNLPSFLIFGFPPSIVTQSC